MCVCVRVYKERERSGGSRGFDPCEGIHDKLKSVIFFLRSVGRQDICVCM